ncbi:unnamed protein product [Boreogadus saida]
MAISLLHFTAFFQGEDNSIERGENLNKLASHEQWRRGVTSPLYGEEAAEPEIQSGEEGAEPELQLGEEGAKLGLQYPSPTICVNVTCLP